jgi:UDP:flavonoid glycosyltransferase YjiC (YdhE family)
VLAAGDFYENSAKAAKKLGVRAVLLIGADARNWPKEELPDSICVAEYAPYSKLFPRVSLAVHQGGVGTTAQCLRAGRPMLIMPYSHDQPDNARRMKRMGLARVIQRSSYKPWRVARRVKAMLAEPEFEGRARAVAEEVAQENGVKAACDALEGLEKRGTGSKE